MRIDAEDDQDENEPEPEPQDAGADNVSHGQRPQSRERAISVSELGFGSGSLGGSFRSAAHALHPRLWGTWRAIFNSLQASAGK